MGFLQEAPDASFDVARSRRSARKSVKNQVLRSPKRKLRKITLFDPRNAFPRLAPRASLISVSLSATSKGASPVACGNAGRCAIPRAQALRLPRNNARLAPHVDSARGCPCHGAGVGNRAQPGWRSEVSSERAEGSGHRSAKRIGRCSERPAMWYGQPRAASPTVFAG
jgi:hypothetical protein